MPLHLITGPANAEKAGLLLDRARELARSGREPMLVVPTRPDALAYRRELARDGLVFGVRVETFGALRREVARRAGVGGRVLGPLARRRAARAAVAATPLRALAASARTPGFAEALAGLCDELAAERIDAGRWSAAMHAWAAAEPARGAYAEELAALCGAYRDMLEAAGGTDPATAAATANSRLLAEPVRWGATPVLLYGFDDLTPVEFDTVRALARAGADVTVSLPFEAGRDDVYRSRARVLGELDELADERTTIGARAEHYEPEARAALHHLERTLFEPHGERHGSPDGPAPDPGDDAVRLLAGGGERAELELIAEQVRRALRDDDLAPEEIAVALRDAAQVAPLVERVFADAGVPIALERRIPVTHTALGAALVALLRAALPGGRAEDVLVWLRLPGLLERPALADALERDLRRTGVRDAAGAHEAWERRAGFRFGELDELAKLADAPARLCRALATRAERLFDAAWARHGDVLPEEGRRDARALGAIRTALADLAALAEAGPPLAPAAAELPELLAAEQVWVGEPAGPGRVTVADPLRLRARRVRVLVLGRLNEGVFPAGADPEPFLGDAERVAVNRAGGLRLRLREDPIDAERWLLYAAVSRPTRRLVLSWHAGDDDGDPRVRSLFVDDVLECFAPAPPGRLATRRLGELAWPAGAALGARQAALARAGAGPGAPPGGGLGPVTDGELLADLRARRVWGGRAIEVAHGCRARWFIEEYLRPEAIEPDPAMLVRGGLYHRVLERTLGGLGERLTPARLARAHELAGQALREQAGRRRLAVREREHEAIVHRIEVDVLRYLAFAAGDGSAFRPAHLELSFGTPHDGRDPVPLGEGVTLSGRIDRVDLGPDGREAIVVDYKGRSGASARRRWGPDGVLQAGLYALALPHLLGDVEVVGALYQPIGAADQRPRGFLRSGADAGREDIVANDRATREEVDDLLAGVREAALAAVRALRTGRIEPSPAGCGHRVGQGCAHPSICRCEGA